MSRKRIPRLARQHLQKARASALCAVENYNRPGGGFRTRTYAVLMVMATTALFHAIFYARGIKPWYVQGGSGKGLRYTRVDGEPKHWELGECLRQYWGDKNPPERSNFEFFIKIRNRIEHRDHPELDPALYGECQALLMNFEDLLVHEFTPNHALTASLAVSLQFSALRPESQAAAVRSLEKSAARDLLEFVRTYRAGLPPEVLASPKYTLSVFLVPKLANRESASDLSIEFVPYDPTKPEEMAQLAKVAALIKERRVPVAFADLLKPSEVVKRVAAELPYVFTQDTHTRAWRHYNVRPPTNSKQKEKTIEQFCVYDAFADAYGYKEAWIRHLVEKLADANEFRAVTSRPPVRRQQKAKT